MDLQNIQNQLNTEFAKSETRIIFWFDDKDIDYIKKKCWTQSATCCRECIRKWHKMYPEKELSQVQLDYLVDVIMTWIQKEMERG